MSKIRTVEMIELKKQKPRLNQAIEHKLTADPERIASKAGQTIANILTEQVLVTTCQSVGAAQAGKASRA